MLKYKSLLLILAITAIMITSCSAKDNSVPVEEQGFFMGTVITEKVYGSNAETAAKKVMDRIQQLEKIMTINSPNSEIVLLNSSAGIDKVNLSPESIFVLNRAKYFSQLSNGAFDVTVGPLVKSWAIGTTDAKVPDKAEIEQLLKLVDYKSITIDEKSNTAQLLKKGQIVDLGGIAKGYAGDEAVKIYKEHDIKSAFINIGGNVVVLGSKPDKTPWKVGIQDPRATRDNYLGIVEVSNKAVVSSGDYERFFEKDGIRYHHILDPYTGYPANSGLMSVTIIADSSIDADALSTATFVLGLQKGIELIESLKGVEAIFITNDKKIYTTKGLKGNFKLTDESKDYEYVEKR